MRSVVLIHCYFPEIIWAYIFCNLKKNYKTNNILINNYALDNITQNTCLIIHLYTESN